MVPARAGGRPLLLLLLPGLWVAQVPVSAKPKHMTSAQWFEIQHVQPSPQGCKGAMDNINKHTKHCKGLNTFLHASFSSVAAACQASVTACKNGHKNCHQSKEPVSLTQCDLTSGKYPACRYKEKQLDMLFIVACDPPQPKDGLRYLLVPGPSDNVVTQALQTPTAAAAAAAAFPPLSSLLILSLCKYHFSPTRPAYSSFRRGLWLPEMMREEK